MTKLATRKTSNLIIETDSDYKKLLEDIKLRLKSSQFKALMTVNHGLIQFYWEVGKLIIKRQEISKWGDGLFELLARDLNLAFPQIQGFSITNLKNMRLFYLHYPKLEFRQALPVELTWTHHVVLIRSFSEHNLLQKQWYAMKTLDNGWGYRRLQEQIKSGLYDRQAHATIKTTNFHAELPAASSELAHEMIKDPYKFHFLTVGEEALEKEIQSGLINHIRLFLMELGQGFAFYGANYPIKVSNKIFEIDLIFYHTRLHSYVVVELKRGSLHPQHTGQLNFYLAAIDDQLKMPEDGPTIGLLLCEKKDHIIAEYALKRVNGPIGIAEYEVLKELPSKLQKILPTIDQIETELSEFNKNNNE